MFEKTPDEITSDILALCETVSPGETPIFVNVIPAPGATENDCYINVPKHIETNGGETIFGWRIWEWPQIMVEAEFHAIWKSPQGEIRDITPMKTGDNRILFIPNRTIVYEGCSINNVRVPLQDDPLIDEFIAINNEIFNVMNKGDRKYAYGLIGIPAEEIENLQEAKIEYQIKIVRKYLRSEDRCPCGSGKKVKHCHTDLSSK